MFDIGFSELVLISVVALIVIGPERLPKAARTMGHLFGRLQRYVNDVKSDIGREIELDELRKLQKEVQSAAQDLKSSVETAARGAESSFKAVEDQLNEGARDAPPPDVLQAPQELTETAFDPAPRVGEPGSELAEAASAAPGRQPSLPGFDRI